jgi:hypothetical protein
MLATIGGFEHHSTVCGERLAATRATRDGFVRHFDGLLVFSGAVSGLFMIGSV